MRLRGMHLRILNPCPMKWDDLEGDGALRGCEKCHKNVVDLTGLTEPDAVAYVRAAVARGQRICGRAEVRDGRLVFAAAAVVAAAMGVAGCTASMEDGATEEMPGSPAAAAAPQAECEGGPCFERYHEMGDISF